MFNHNMEGISIMFRKIGIDENLYERLDFFRLENRYGTKDLSKVFKISISRMCLIMKKRVLPTEMQLYHIDKIIKKWEDEQKIIQNEKVG